MSKDSREANRAVLESICFQVNDVLKSMHKDALENGGVESKDGSFLLRVNGGANANNLLMQTEADSLDHTMDCSAQLHASLA